ncbi:hypothetical protein [Escherichia phage vB_EcoP_PAS7]|uniref:Uncharacterized protein n=1 Tax=Escherichia phage vB_EcoP_PAS7 TaxID=3053875 RepID=A0AA51VHC4_9CAUD|nr:hypothetical protein [Escherichia phage vB_EcoP_PAS7]
MIQEDDFDTWYNIHVRHRAREEATRRKLAALNRGHSEKYAKKLASETYNEYLTRNLK